MVGMLLMWLLALAATIIQMAISRSREYIADDTGAHICGHPLWLARALDKLSRGNEAVPNAGCEPGYGPHVHRQPFRWGGRTVSPLFNPSTHRRADRPSPAHGGIS